MCEGVPDARIEKLHAAGMTDANIYNPKDSSVGGTHAFFLVRGDASQYNLPANPEVPTTLLAPAWKSAAQAAGVIALGAFVAFAFGGKKR